MRLAIYRLERRSDDTDKVESRISTTGGVSPPQRVTTPADLLWPLGPLSFVCPHSVWYSSKWEFCFLRGRLLILPWWGGFHPPWSAFVACPTGRCLGQLLRASRSLHTKLVGESIPLRLWWAPVVGYWCLTSPSPVQRLRVLPPSSFVRCRLFRLPTSRPPLLSGFVGAYHARSTMYFSLLSIHIV